MTEAPAGNTPTEASIATWPALLRSFGVLTAGEVVARGVSFGAVIWVTRRLSLDEFGVVALGGNMVLWFGVVVNASTQTIGLRDVAAAPQRFRSILEPLLGVRLAFSLVAMVMLALLALALGNGPHQREVLLLFLLVVPLLALNLRFSLLAVGSARAVAVGNVASQVVFAAGVLLLVRGAEDGIYVPLAQAAGELVFAGYLLAAVAPRFGLLRPRLDAGVWRAHLRETAPLIATQASRATINWFDLVLIAALLSRRQVGLYAAAYRPVLFATYSLALLFVSFLASYIAARADAARELLLSRTVRLTTALGVAAAVPLSAGAGPLVTLLFGDRYADAAVPLAILAWTIPLFALGSIFGMVLVAHGRQALAMWHNLAGATLNVAANLAAVPTLGITAAAAVTAASWLVVVALNHRSCVRLGHSAPLTRLLRRAGPAPPGV